MDADEAESLIRKIVKEKLDELQKKKLRDLKEQEEQKRGKT